MKLISVNVGQLREVTWKGHTVTTGIFKEPLEGRVRLRKTGLEGDHLANLDHHGGPDKAAFAYPSEHYSLWRSEIKDMELTWGMFGENLTVEGLLEEEVHIGDQFRIGSAVAVVTVPRKPCFKLDARFGREGILKRYLDARRIGFYMRVVGEGEVAAGDPIELMHRDPLRVTVADITRIYLRETEDPDLINRALQLEALPENAREKFRQRMERGQ